METTDLTIRILQEIRDEARKTNQRLESLEEKVDRRFAEGDARLHAVETTLRDLAEQMVMLARGIKVLIESKGSSGYRVDELEKRVSELERKVG
ncbi:MAG: hypothetical protein HY791_24420 [Deltaproteobacteria bacterium]|nr:hypothetical protein [Deltaproteobacteria bacterium]